MWAKVSVRAEARADLGVVSCFIDASTGHVTIPRSVAAVILDATTKADQQEVRIDGITMSIVSTATGKTQVRLLGSTIEFIL